MTFPLPARLPCLNWWKQIRPVPHLPSGQETAVVTKHTPSVFYVLSHARKDAKLNIRERTQTYKRTKTRAQKNVAVRSHNVTRWLGGRDKCCQLDCQSLTQHRAANRTQTLSSHTAGLRPNVDLTCLAHTIKWQSRQQTVGRGELQYCNSSNFLHLSANMFSRIQSFTAGSGTTAHINIAIDDVTLY